MGIGHISTGEIKGLQDALAGLAARIGEDCPELVQAQAIISEVARSNAPIPLDEGMHWYDIEFTLHGCIGVVAESEDAARSEVECMDYSTLAEDAADITIESVELDEESLYEER